jgi:hypothetical protein
MDPPSLRRDCDNKPIIRAKLEGEGICACTHHRASSTGILAVKKSPTGTPGFMIRLTGLKP